MMHEATWECEICPACGVCSRTEKECDTYHEYYGEEEMSKAKKLLIEESEELSNA